MCCCWSCKHAIQLKLYDILCNITMNEYDENYGCEDYSPVDEKTKDKRLNDVYW